MTRRCGAVFWRIRLERRRCFFLPHGQYADRGRVSCRASFAAALFRQRAFLLPLRPADSRFLDMARRSGSRHAFLHGTSARRKRVLLRNHDGPAGFRSCRALRAAHRLASGERRLSRDRPFFLSGAAGSAGFREKRPPAHAAAAGPHPGGVRPSGRSGLPYGGVRRQKSLGADLPPEDDRTIFPLKKSSVRAE